MTNFCPRVRHSRRWWTVIDKGASLSASRPGRPGPLDALMMPRMSERRVAIVGSFSTGKTTLAEVVAPKLDLPLLPEVAREVVELGFKLDKDATVETEAL